MTFPATIDFPSVLAHKPLPKLAVGSNLIWPMYVTSSTYQPDGMRPMTLGQRGLHLRVHASTASANYTIISQSKTEVMVPQNSPSISMWPYLVHSSQTGRLRGISVYAERGKSREQIRILYMNREGLALWHEMGMPGLVIGESHRPSHCAVLSFGVPFSE
jgi:hypothetical protein